MSRSYMSRLVRGSGFLIRTMRHNPGRLIRRAHKRLQGVVALYVNQSTRITIAMFHSGRCGSTVLGDLLDQNPRIYWDDEIYTKLDLKAKRPGCSGSDIPVYDLISYLRDRMKISLNTCYGFEVKYYQLAWGRITLETYLERLRELGVRYFISLKRRNVLRQMASAMILMATARSNRYANEPTSLNKVSINLSGDSSDDPKAALVKRIEALYKTQNRLSSLLDSTELLELNYEDHIEENPIRAYNNVCNFVGIPQTPVTVFFMRMNPFAISDMIINFDEVEQALRGTEYEWMLYK